MLGSGPRSEEVFYYAEGGIVLLHCKEAQMIPLSKGRNKTSSGFEACSQPLFGVDVHGSPTRKGLNELCHFFPSYHQNER